MTFTPMYSKPQLGKIKTTYPKGKPPLGKIKTIQAFSIDYKHIIVKCDCKQKRHQYGSEGNLSNRMEHRISHCMGGSIYILVNHKTIRPFRKL